MAKFLKPLWIFFTGQIFILFLWLFLPTIYTYASNLLTDVPDALTYFWGWSWAVGGIRLTIVVLSELFVLWNTGRAFPDAN